MNTKTKNIGLFGFGQVGQGLYNVINGTGYKGAAIKTIVVKNSSKARTVSRDLLRYNKNEVLKDESIDIIVEAIDDADEAFIIVKTALQNGTPVVTANKKMVAQNLEELIALQEEFGTPLLYEGAVCGAIPIVQTIEKYFAYEPLNSVQGIFNGTSNYILSKIFNDRLDYSLALKQAQDLGFAESDPTNDVQAFDPKYKVIILAKHAFGLTLKPSDVLNFGIDTFTPDDIRFAREHQFKIKVLPIAFAHGDDVFAYVLPQFIEQNNRFYDVENEFNAVLIDAPYAGNQFYFGRGAGSLPTGVAVFNDVHDIVNGSRYGYHKKQPFVPSDENELLLEVYLRYSKDSVKEAVKFERITEGYISSENSFVIGYASLKSLKEQIHRIHASGSTIIATGKRLMRKTANGYLNNNVNALSEKTMRTTQ